MLNFLDFDPANSDHLDAFVKIWNDAYPPDLNLTVNFARYNLQPLEGRTLAGQIAMQGNQPVGVVVASHAPALDFVAASTGWLDALAVAGEAEAEAVRSSLLDWAENWLRGRDCQSIQVGGSLRHFAPGLFDELEQEVFLLERGYQFANGDAEASTVWDLARSLADYTPPPTLREVDAAVHPAQPGQVDALLAFLQREFPGRWRWECEQFLRGGGRPSDYMLLWTERGVDGFCKLTFEDSARPIECYYPYTLPRPWAQLGSVGVGAEVRGRGYGAAVVDAGLRRLHNNGVNGCVIDWTTLVDFYGKFGFTKYRTYRKLVKAL